jgi:hypothetical protein
MSRASEIMAITVAVRHCNEYGCRKCIARARWGPMPAALRRNG